MVVFGIRGCIRARWLYSGNLVVFWPKWLYSGKSGCIRGKVVASGKVVKFGKTCCIRTKKVVLG